jgi:hypothetical protein
VPSQQPQGQLQTEHRLDTSSNSNKNNNSINTNQNYHQEMREVKYRIYSDTAFQ